MDISLLRQLGAFAEYVARPFTDYLRIILEKMGELKLPLTERLLRETAIAVGLWHITGELIRATCYITITWIIAGVCRDILLRP